VNNPGTQFTLELTKKDVIGLYISLTHPERTLNDSSARILKTIEDYLFTFLTIDQFEHIEDIYLE
jgi:hypothetical protein